MEVKSTLQLTVGVSSISHDWAHQHIRFKKPKKPRSYVLGENPKMTKFRDQHFKLSNQTGDLSGDLNFLDFQLFERSQENPTLRILLNTELGKT